MRRSIRKALACLFDITMCLSLNSVVFAAEPLAENTSSKVSQSNISMNTQNMQDINDLARRGSISGYAQGTITKERNTLVVWCDSSAIVNSGMGITVNASNANFNGFTTVKGYPKQGTAASFSGRQLHMGTEIIINDLYHRGCSAYVIQFDNLQPGQSFLAKVWIYG